MRSARFLVCILHHEELVGFRENEMRLGQVIDAERARAFPVPFPVAVAPLQGHSIVALSVLALALVAPHCRGDRTCCEARQRLVRRVLVLLALWRSLLLLLLQMQCHLVKRRMF